MKELSLKELQQVELQILKNFHRVCIEENFRYSLCGGTLLGAIRHKGFIPWDDDIDVLMPRPDYEKLITYCQSHITPFRLVCNQLEKNYGYLAAKIVDQNTVLIEENSNPKNVEMGVYIDIFPVDGLGNTYQEARKRFMAKEFSRELLIAANWKRFFKSKTHSWYYEPVRYAFFLLSRFVRFERIIKHIEKYYAKWNFDQSDYVGCVCGDGRIKEICCKDEYTQFVPLEFEDGVFLGLKEYDKYLTRLYGNYMQLPPEEKRISHHAFKAYKKNIHEEISE